MFSASGATFTNTGTVTGGNGGAGGAGGSGGLAGGDGSPGAGGVGVVGGDLTIINSGSISGGLSGSGVRADAIDFTSGSNTLTLSGGWSLTGGHCNSVRHADV